MTRIADNEYMIRFSAGMITVGNICRRRRDDVMTVVVGDGGWWRDDVGEATEGDGGGADGADDMKPDARTKVDAMPVNPNYPKVQMHWVILIVVH